MVTLASFKYLSMGAVLGLTAGISPGPLLTLVLTETLRKNKEAGIKVAISPLITDLPIILISLFVFSRLSQMHDVLSVISLLGGIYIAFLGYEALKTKGLDLAKHVAKSGSLKKGIIANFLNPNPYLFWVTVGTPLIINALEISLITVMLFLISFYVLLTGSKIIIVLIVARSKAFLGNKTYMWIMRFLGIVLFLFAFYFLYDGIKYLLDKSMI